MKNETQFYPVLAKEIGVIKNEFEYYPILANEMIDMHGGNAIRWMMLNTHYRLALNFSDEVLDTAKKELEKIKTPIKQLEIKAQLANVEYVGKYDEEAMKPFIDALNDDLNISNAITVVYEVVKELNQLIRTREINYELAKDKEATLVKMLEVLGIFFPEIKLTEEDKETFNKWNAAKAEKNFDEADKYRAILVERGLA